MSADELLTLGDIGPCELIRGKLIRMSPANPRHGLLVTFLAETLSPYVRSQRLGRVFTGDVGFKLASDPDTVRAPDIALIAGDRGNRLPQRGYFEGAPELAIEVISPDDRWSEVEAKVEDWLSAGCRVVWLVDPRTQTVTIHGPGREARTLKSGDTLDGGDVIPGFQLTVKAIFDELA